MSAANVKPANAGGRSQNGTRQAVRCIKDMFRKDGLT